jgi:hypothetical protein
MPFYRQSGGLADGRCGRHRVDHPLHTVFDHLSITNARSEPIPPGTCGLFGPVGQPGSRVG